MNLQPSKRFPPVLLATCVLPWDERLELAEEVFRRHVRERAGLTPHLYVLGTAGEGYALSERRFDEVVRVFLDEAGRAGAAPMVGVVSLALATVVERIERARELGCRSFQLSLPSWGALADAEVDAFFAETCGRFPDCSFLHYNLPRAKRVLAAADYARLAATHPNLVAVKYSTEDVAALEACCTSAPELQVFPTEIGYSLLRDRHECGLLVSLSATHPERCRELLAARGERLAELGGDARRLLAALVAAVGPGPHMDGAFEKVIAALHHPEFPLRLLPPYLAAPEEAVERYRAALPIGWR